MIGRCQVIQSPSKLYPPNLNRGGLVLSSRSR